MLVATLFIVPALAALITGLVPRTRQSIISYTASIASGIEALVAIVIAYSVAQGAIPSATSYFTPDALGAFVISIVAVVGFAAAIDSISHLRHEQEKDIIGFSRYRQYFILFHLFFFAMYIASLTTNPLIMWVAVEATTLATAFLTTFYNKASALEAGWKQLIVNSVALLLGLLGTLLFLSAGAGAGNASALISWHDLSALAASFNPTLVKIAFVFILIGYGTKTGFVPLHTWKPDAYSKTPSPIAALFSGALLSTAFVAILRFQHITAITIGTAFSHWLLIGFGLLSIVTAAFLMTGPKNYKRLLAYSSIEHGGVMALGFGVGGVGIIGALFHMMYHALAKPILFFSAGNFFMKFSSTKIAQVRGAIHLIPFSAIMFFGGVLAATGMPPFGIFFTKLTILGAAMNVNPAIALIALAAFAIVFANLVRHSVSMVFGEPPKDLEPGEAGPLSMVSLIILAVLFIILSVWTPPALGTLITHAAQCISS